jgi:hypothetical protein
MSADPQPKLTGIVIRADGTVPFDAEVDPAVRAAALVWCMANDYTVSPIKGTSSFKIHNWKPPHQPKG